MCRNIPAIFTILLLGTLVLCCACVGSGNESPKQNTSLVQVTVQSESSRIGFDTALQKLKNYKTVSFNQTPADSEKIYYILAKDVDDRGAATSWLFGVNDRSGSRLIIYDKVGKTEMPLSDSSLPSEEIVLDHIVSPGKVFSDNKEVILRSPVPSTPELRELELKEGLYTITITSGNAVRVIKFNATTGALIG